MREKTSHLGGDLYGEPSVLTRATENLFRKIIRFLVGRMSLTSLLEMIRYIFVEEIENKLRAENPQKNIKLSQLALLSGLDTRTLTKIRNSERYRKPLYEEANFLKEFSPGASVLDIWSSTPPYIDESSSQPRKLPIAGKAPSFESLFAQFGRSRGVTYQSLLQRLAESGAVIVDEDRGEVSLVLTSYLPSNSEDKLGAIEMGFSALGNLVDTVTRNIEALDSRDERLYQRGAWTYRLNNSDKQQLRVELRTLLERTDSEARKIIQNYEHSNSGSNQITAGISLFYFEESRT